MDEREALKQFVERWRRAGPLLEAFEHKELREFSLEQHWPQSAGLLQLGYEMSQREPVPTSSGLVEQQRLFTLARRLPNG